MCTVTARPPSADDITSIVDGCLLVDLWDELFLPTVLRTAWANTIHTELS